MAMPYPDMSETERDKKDRIILELKSQLYGMQDVLLKGCETPQEFKNAYELQLLTVTVEAKKLAAKNKELEEKQALDKKVTVKVDPKKMAAEKELETKLNVDVKEQSLNKKIHQLTNKLSQAQSELNDDKHIIKSLQMKLLEWEKKFQAQAELNEKQIKSLQMDLLECQKKFQAQAEYEKQIKSLQMDLLKWQKKFAMLEKEFNDYKTSKELPPSSPVNDVEMAPSEGSINAVMNLSDQFGTPKFTQTDVYNSSAISSVSPDSAAIASLSAKLSEILVNHFQAVQQTQCYLSVTPVQSISTQTQQVVTETANMYSGPIGSPPMKDQKSEEDTGVLNLLHDVTTNDSSTSYKQPSEIPNIKLSKPTWLERPFAILVFSLVLLCYVLVTGGFIYYAIMMTPSTGTVTCECPHSCPVEIDVTRESEWWGARFLYFPLEMFDKYKGDQQ